MVEPAIIICLDKKLQENEQGLCTFKNLARTRNVSEGLQSRQKNRVQPFIGNALKSGKNSYDSTFIRPFALHQVVALPRVELYRNYILCQPVGDLDCIILSEDVTSHVTIRLPTKKKIFFFWLQMDFSPKRIHLQSN